MNPSAVPDYVMNSLCRICAEKSSKLTPIFKNEFFSWKILKCLSIQVKESDHLPLNVCESCFFKVGDSYTLYETAQKADEKLRKLWRILIKETLKIYPEGEPEKGGEIPAVSVLGDGNDSRRSSNIPINIPEKEENIEDDVQVLGKMIAIGIISSTNHNVLVNCNNEKISQCQVAGVPQESAEPEKKPASQEKGKSRVKGKVHQCQFCSCQLSTQGVLSVHESTHSDERPYLCDVCGKSFRHSNNLKCHSRAHVTARKKYICRICSKGFLSNFFLQEHMNSHTGDTPYKCGDCGKEFREKIHLRQHRWTHSTHRFACPVCGNTFSRKGNMNEHIKKYHGDNSAGKSATRSHAEGNSAESGTNFKCPSCGRVFSNQILLKAHLKSHPDQKRFFCAICGKKFRHSGSLTYHRRTAHTGERPFQCSYCEEKFSLRSVQKIHERKKHTFEHPYKCTHCSRLFTHSSSLTNHLFVHSKGKMFECDECGKKFSRSSNLFVHKKLHSGDRRFTCDQCGKSYIQKHDMVKHQKIHDPKRKPFFCKYCGHSFSHKKDSSKHGMCQFEFIKKNNSDICSAERILDSVTNTLDKNGKEFFIEEEELIDDFPGENTSKSGGGCEEPHNSAGV